MKSSRPSWTIKQETKAREIPLRSRLVIAFANKMQQKNVLVKADNKISSKKILSKITKYEVGSKIFAKVKGYKHWLAVITESRASNYKVQFFGTNDFRVIKSTL